MMPARLSTTLDRWIFRRFLIGCQLFSILHAFPLVSPAVVSTNTHQQHGPSTFPLAGAAVSMIWDGPAWQHLRNDDDDSSTSGTARAVVGSTEDHARVVALEVLDSPESERTTQLQDGTRIYKDSIAPILPGKPVSDAQAAATLLQAIPIHTVWPKANAVGSSTTSHHVDEPTVVVVGSTSTDTRSAPMLAALGAKVTVVGNKDTTSQYKNIQFLSNKNDTPFCDAVGSFDALIDTLTDPSPSIRERLAAEHGCHSVVSTVSGAAATVQTHGLLNGPKRVKQDIILEQDHAYYRPTAGLGDLVARLLATDYTTKDIAAEQRLGWSWSGYWESTMWPRDTAGGMFGYPATNEYDEEDDEDDEDFDDDDDDDEDEENTATGLVGRLLQEQREQQAEIELETRSSSSSGGSQQPAPGSRVTPVASRQDLQDHVVSPQTTSVVLFTAPFCRTCRYLKPLYNRLAGQEADHDDDLNFYIVPDAASPEGKDLSRLLNVDAVPAVVMFKRGRRWGQTISLSSIPDPHLSQALEWLRTDQDFDAAFLEKLPRKKQRRR